MAGSARQTYGLSLLQQLRLVALLLCDIYANVTRLILFANYKIMCMNHRFEGRHIYMTNSPLAALAAGTNIILQ
jgi:hypothetical protein